MDTAATHAWWSLLCAVAVVNAVAWSLSVLVLRRRHAGGPDWDLRRWQLLLSAGYVAGCAWRSAVPVFDVPRLVLVDSWASSVLVGRSVATVAELCFAAQWALLLHAAARACGSASGRAASRVLVPMIVLAEVCSWHAVLTTANLGHVIEETLWGTAALVVVGALLVMRRRLAPALQPLVLLIVAAGLAYAAYMFGVDVPMYWARWVADEAAGRAYLDVAQGLRDVATRWVVSADWTHWKTEVTWMTLYFSVAVWASIGLAHAPAWQRAVRGQPAR